MTHAIMDIDTETGIGTATGEGGPAAEFGELEKGSPPVGRVYKRGVILWTQDSPGCVYYFYGGQWWKICS